MASAPTAGRSRLDAIRPTSPVQAALAVGAAAFLIVFLVVHTRDDEIAAPAPAQQAGIPSEPTAVTPAQLASRSSATGRRIYWVGPRPATTYELKEDETGNVFLRYLPTGTPAGADGSFTTIGTYQFAGAFNSTQIIGREPGAVMRDVPGDGVAVYREDRPTSVYVAYPGLDYQIEVYDPDPAQALRLATSATLKPAGGPAAAVPPLEEDAARAVSPADLKALSASLGRPIYWVGPRRATTYELTRKGDELFLRYLPAGSGVGTKELQLTVGTYKLADAFDVTTKAASRPGAREVNAGITAVAFYRPARPESVYVAYRGEDYQVEVYDPRPGAARRLVTQGRLRPVG